MKETSDTANKPNTFKELIQSTYFWKRVAGTIIGGVAGFLYYYFVGCASGTCAITSSPFLSFLFGATMGLFLVNKP